jgi:iron complex transport system substrate-binding protein
MMNKWQRNPFFLFLCIILVLALAGCSQSNIGSPQIQPSTPASNSTLYPVTITNFDAAERPILVTYKQAPSRVVITHPGATELLLELGLEDRILCTVAPYGAPLDRVAEKYARLNIMKAQFVPTQEELIAMQPDMIIGWAHHFDENKLGNVKSWQKRGMATFVMQSSLTHNKPTLENVVYACLSDMGKIFGIQEKTELYIKHYKERVALVEKAVQDISKKKNVIVLQDHANGTFSIYDSSYLISHMIDIAGGKNLCENPTFLVSA